MFSITPYEIQVKDEAGYSIGLDDLGDGTSFKEFAESFLRLNLNNIYDSKVNKKAFFIDEKFKGSDKSIVCKTLAGDYGYVVKIFDMKNNRPAGEVKTHQASLTPFYLGIYFNDEDVHKNRALLIFQRFKTNGIKTVFFEQFNEYFKSRFNGLKIVINHVIPYRVLKKFLECDQIKTIRLIAKQIPKSLEDNFSEFPKEKIRDFEISVSAKRNLYFSDLSWIYDICVGNIKPSDVITIDDFVPEKIKVDVTINGKPKIFDITNPARLKPNVDLSSIKVDENGHPDTNEMILALDDLASEIYNQWTKKDISFNSSSDFDNFDYDFLDGEVTRRIIDGVMAKEVRNG